MTTNCNAAVSSNNKSAARRSLWISAACACQPLTCIEGFRRAPEFSVYVLTRSFLANDAAGDAICNIEMTTISGK